MLHDPKYGIYFHMPIPYSFAVKTKTLCSIKFKGSSFIYILHSQI